MSHRTISPSGTDSIPGFLICPNCHNVVPEHTRAERISCGITAMPIYTTHKVWHAPVARMYLDVGYTHVTRADLFAAGTTGIARASGIPNVHVVLDDTDVDKINTLMRSLAHEYTSDNGGKPSVSPGRDENH